MADMDNRKGDVTITTVILIVLGLVVLVMMIIGFTKGWSFFFGLFDKGPSELQSIAEACVLYARAGFSIDYCQSRDIKINGKAESINCNDVRISGTLESAGVKALTCANNPVNLVSGSAGSSNVQRVIEVPIDG